MQPPVAPIGLDYIAETLHAAGHVVQLLDLCWEENPHSAINHFFKSSEFGLVGIVPRGLCSWVLTRESRSSLWFRSNES